MAGKGVFINLVTKQQRANNQCTFNDYRISGCVNFEYGPQKIQGQCFSKVVLRKNFRITPYIYYACRMINYVCALFFQKTIATP